MERKPISKKLRFEVFKKDHFTCQYCGRKSPDVILEIDHIKPVAEGGTNDILNLITSCRDCNRGKGKTKLDNQDILSKEQQTLEELAEKREQIDMMIDWQHELMGMNDKCLSAIQELFNDYELELAEQDTKLIKKYIDKYGYEITCKAVFAYIHQYYDFNKKHFYKTFDFIERICVTLEKQKNNPILKLENQLWYMFRKKYNPNREYTMRLIHENLKTEEQLEEIIKVFYDYDRFNDIEERIRGVEKWQ